MIEVVWAKLARSEYLDAIAPIQANDPGTARRVPKRIAKTIEPLRVRNSGRPGRVERTYEKSVTGLRSIASVAIEDLGDGRRRPLILRVIHTSRHWPIGGWPR